MTSCNCEGCSCKPKREIKFVREDFVYHFEKLGMNIDTLLDEEWDKFYDMFCSGTHWDEVAEIAAWEIARNREEAK